MATNPIVYLENYIEYAAALPPELTRLLTTVKDLDERSLALAEKIRVAVEACLAKPPLCDLKPETAVAAEIQALQRQIEADQRMLVHWAEEKMSLACVMADLLDLHVLQLDRDLQGLEAELDGVSMDIDDYDPVATAEEARRQRQRELESEAELRVQEQKRREREEAERRQAPAVGSRAASAAPGGTPGVAAGARPSRSPNATAGFPAQNGGRRAGGDALPTLGSELSSKRKAAAAAVHAAAAALQEEGLEEDGFGTLDEGRPPQPYMPMLPPGFQTSAPTPQAPGRLLAAADIGEGLRGRRAELFWPDDNLWYLIEIHDLDLVQRRAQIMYVTGETEQLDLAEIVRDGHMSLIQG